MLSWLWWLLVIPPLAVLALVLYSVVAPFFGLGWWSPIPLLFPGGMLAWYWFDEGRYR